MKSNAATEGGSPRLISPRSIKRLQRRAQEQKSIFFLRTSRRLRGDDSVGRDMPDDLTFMMGKYAARLPADLRYARNHMWCRTANHRHRFGFSAYAVRLMQDVYFLDWCVNAGDVVVLKQQIGNIETSKAVADLFAPIGSTVEAFNTELLKDPSGINVDCYGPGWLFDMTGDADCLIDAQAYHDFLTATWESTQRLIKGQINTE